MEKWLIQVFAYQLNAWFEVTHQPRTNHDYDADNDGIAPFWTTLIPMRAEGARHCHGQIIPST